MNVNVKDARLKINKDLSVHECCVSVCCVRVFISETQKRKIQAN